MKPLLFTLPAVFAAGGGILAFARRRSSPPRHLSMAPTSLLGPMVKSDGIESIHGHHASEDQVTQRPHATSLASIALSALLVILLISTAVIRMGGNGTSLLSLFAVSALTAVALKLSSAAPTMAPNPPHTAPTPPHALALASLSSPTLNSPSKVVRPSPLLQGVWIRDSDRSDSMTPVMDRMKLGGLVRMAVKLVRGCEIKLIPSHAATAAPSSDSPAASKSSVEVFQLDVFSAIKWFKVREKYELSGRPGMFKRRDLRGGKHEGRVEVLEDGSLRLHLEWKEPYGGRGTDTFRMVSDDEMHVLSELRMEGSESKLAYNTVYRRKR